jgi:hypothetical protein
MHTTYAVNAGQTKMQAMAFLEDGSKATGIGMIPGIPGVDEAWAGGSSYSARTPVSKGDALGIVLSNTGGNVNQPVQERYDALSFTGLDIINTQTGYTAYFSSKNTLSGTGTKLAILKSTYTQKNNSLDYDSSMVAYWDMETLASDGKLADLSGNGNN